MVSDTANEPLKQKLARRLDHLRVTVGASNPGSHCT